MTFQSNPPPSAPTPDSYRSHGNPPVLYWAAIALLLGLLILGTWPRRPDVQQEHRPAPENPTGIAASDPTVQITPQSDAGTGIAHNNDVPHPTNPTRRSRPERDLRYQDHASGEVVDPLKLPNQTIRDHDGRVVYRGAIDLHRTLDRIERGERNPHRNDGAVFQNRERRLPPKPAGYYREYVQPTPGVSGPGPQRVMIGQEGDVWYTPDHYQSFQRIK